MEDAALAPAPRTAGYKGASRSLFPALLLTLTLGWLWFVLCRQLSYEWSANEQYNYGWFVPFFATFLFWLRYEEAPLLRSSCRFSVNCYLEESGVPPLTHNQKLITIGAFSALALLAPIRLFEVANPDWRPLSWAHALVVVGLTLVIIGYCFRRAGRPSAESGWKADFRFDWVAVRYFAFPVCFILVAVPWLTPIEAPLVQGLMRVVASVATEILTLFGVPAQLEGNLIRVSSGVVGVSEACSGVRSLQTSLMIGLLFGELKRLTVLRRFALVGAALAIAFLANCGRAFFLVWIAATQSLAAVGRWHDFAGYAIVALVFVGTVAIASALEDGHPARLGRRPARPAKRSDQAGGLTTESGQRREEELRITKDEGRSEAHLPHFSFPPLSFVICTLCWLLLIEASTSSWYRWHERNFVATPRWTVQWPESAPGFHTLPIDDNVRSTLRYDAGREAAWKVALAETPNEQRTVAANCTLFFFRWDSGSASILRARAHRPDICLPNTGWRLLKDEGVRDYVVDPGFVLPFRHFRFIHDRGPRPVYADAFFCQREDRVPRAAPDRFDATAGRTGNWMRSDRVRVVWEGLRNQGQQVMELVLMTPTGISSKAAEAQFASLVPRLVTQEGRSKN